MRVQQVVFVFALVVVGCLLLPEPSSAQQQINAWRGLIPLTSSRADVEKLLGKPAMAQLNIYDTPDEVVAVWYSEGTCEQNKKATWNAPKDVVLRILVSPKRTLGIGDIKVARQKDVAKTKDDKVPDTFHYRSLDGSLEAQTKLLSDGTEDVVFMAFAPKVGDSNLRCQRGP